VSSIFIHFTSLLSLVFLFKNYFKNWFNLRLIILLTIFTISAFYLSQLILYTPYSTYLFQDNTQSLGFGFYLFILILFILIVRFKHLEKYILAEFRLLIIMSILVLIVILINKEIMPINLFLRVLYFFLTPLLITFNSLFSSFKVFANELKIFVLLFVTILFFHTLLYKGGQYYLTPYIFSIDKFVL